VTGGVGSGGGVRHVLLTNRPAAVRRHLAQLLTTS
jgi:hypothetical protein